MQLKKTLQASLESKRKTYFLIGLVFSLSVTLVAFEWTTYDKIDNETLGETDTKWDISEFPPIVMLKKLPKPVVKNTQNKRPDIKVAVSTTQITISENPNNKNELPDLGDLGLTAMSNEVDSIIENIDPFAPIEEMPGFTGGEKARLRFIKKNIKYPKIPLNEKIGGKVYIEFVVEKDGTLSNFAVARGANPYLDEEALRVAKLMPKWKPGKQRNKTVRAGIRMPIKFTPRN
jgi:periplasmic protein TonB